LTPEDCDIEPHGLGVDELEEELKQAKRRQTVATFQELGAEFPFTEEDEVWSGVMSKDTALSLTSYVHVGVCWLE
jgi:hypothetical protein